MGVAVRERLPLSKVSPLLDPERVKAKVAEPELVSCASASRPHHEEAERSDPRPHHQHPHLPGGGSGRVRDPGVEAGEDSQEETGRQEVRAHAQIQLDQRELRGAGSGRAAAQASQSRGAVEVRRLLLFRHHCDYHNR